MLDFLTDNVEANSLGKRSALADSDNITDSEAESGRAVSSNGLVALLEPVVLLDVMEVVAADDDSVLHLGGNDDTPKQYVRTDDLIGIERPAIIINKKHWKKDASKRE